MIGQTLDIPITCTQPLGEAEEKRPRAAFCSIILTFHMTLAFRFWHAKFPARSSSIVYIVYCSKEQQKQLSLRCIIN
jgi:hypothetical protein